MATTPIDPPAEACQEDNYLWTNIVPITSLATISPYLCFHKGRLYQWYQYTSNVAKDFMKPTFHGVWVLVPTIPAL